MGCGGMYAAEEDERREKFRTGDSHAMHANVFSPTMLRELVMHARQIRWEHGSSRVRSPRDEDAKSQTEQAND